ncbi:MAG: hypothetical protein ACR2NX_16160, partial [Chthoniobacterales bacterium]
MPAERNRPNRDAFNGAAQLPYELRIQDFEIAMQDVYDLFFDVNSGLLAKGLERLGDFLKPAIMSGFISDLLTASIAKHARALTINAYFNGHPDLVVKGIYPNDSVKAGTEGVEIKTTRKSGGAVDTHGARDQWMAVFVYDVDIATQWGCPDLTDSGLRVKTPRSPHENTDQKAGARARDLHRAIQTGS